MRTYYLWVVLVLFGAACNKFTERDAAPASPNAETTSSLQAMGPLDFVTVEEAKEILGSPAGVTIYVRNDDGPTARSYQYVGANANVLTVTVLLEGGRELVAIDPKREELRKACSGIGDACYQPRLSELQVLKGDVYFALYLQTTARRWPGLLNVVKRDEVAKKIAKRLP